MRRETTPDQYAGDGQAGADGRKESVGITEPIIFDILGREITALVNEELKPGIYEVEWDASNYPSGVYYYTLLAGDFKETRKMVLIK